MSNNLLKITLISPRGFCAGVKRAIDTVNKALSLYGAPIYVKHQIVHNKRVVSDFEKKGVIFIESLSEVPPNGILIFNAHGVTKEFEDEVKEKNITFIDATCPLVHKVHKEAIFHSNNNKNIIIIGHSNHPEVIATKSKINGTITIINNIDEAKNFIPEKNVEYAYVTQTTLNSDYIQEIANILKQKIPNLSESKNICYATQNRQNAIKQVIKSLDGLLIIGSNNSSNSNRLVELGNLYGIKSFLIDSTKNIPWEDLKFIKHLGISAGASSPSYLLEEILTTIALKIKTEITNLEVISENVSFILPKFPKD